MIRLKAYSSILSIRVKLNYSRSLSSYTFLEKAKLSLKENEHKTFLHDKYGTYSYGKVLQLSKSLSEEIQNRLGKSDLQSCKIGVYCANNYSYLISILAIWMANGVPFCLSKLYPPKFMEHFLNDSECKLIINSQETGEHLCGDFASILSKNRIVNLALHENDYFKHIGLHNQNKMDLTSTAYENLIEKLTRNEKCSEAFLLYTSGTSGPPKGVKITFENLFSSIESVVEAYKWSPHDFILNPLPLNHYSGLIYCLLTSFFVGAQVDLLSKFNAEIVWSKLLDLDTKLNMFIGVPTIYNQLIQTYFNTDLKNKWDQELIRRVLRLKMRFIGSGSAPLSLNTFKDWYNLTHYNIVERYGMSEVGMALSNPYIESKEFKRRGGYVGRPFGQVKCRIFDLSANKVLIESDSKSNRLFDQNDKQVYGELQIKGPNVFKEYHNNKEVTKNSFTEDGWFKTGDTALFDRTLSVYKILGRTSVDVIKTGGYKVSALDVEKVIISNELIEDVAVMGLRDSLWGQKIFALLVLKPSRQKEFDEAQFLDWCKQNLPKYSVPTIVRYIDKLPRNQLGKVNKKDLISKFDQQIDEENKKN